MNLLPLIPLVVLLLVSIALIVSLFRRRHKTKSEWLISAVVAGAFVGYALLLERWDVFGYFLRPIVALAFAVAFVVSLRRVWRSPWWASPGSARGWLSLGSNVLVGVVFLALFAFAARGLSAGDERPVGLSFPLKDGVSYVGQGGASPQLNYHNAYPPAQSFAVDILGLNAWGFHATGLTPEEPGRYAVFGREISSPCDGRVMESRDGLEDLSPPETDTENPSGNHVVVRCEGVEPAVDVLLAHMSQGSVAVEAGGRVREGEVVGKVGNTGNTSEPHLHIHAVRTGSGSVLEGEGVPIRFDGRFLVRNSLVFGG